MLLLTDYVVSYPELPKPTLGDLTEMKSIVVKIRRARSPNILGYSFKELMELDKIEVELEPDKKGLILKHREYTVSSRVCFAYL